MCRYAPRTFDAEFKKGAPRSGFWNHFKLSAKRVSEARGSTLALSDHFKELLSDIYHGQVMGIAQERQPSFILSAGVLKISCLLRASSHYDQNTRLPYDISYAIETKHAFSLFLYSI